MQLKASEYKPKEISKIIREWTELTQKDFAKSLNKSKRTIESWEYGTTTMSLKTFLEITNKYGIDVIIRKK